MKSFGVVLIPLVFWAWITNAQQLSIANLTTCGLDCLLRTIPQANCTLADAKCQCSSTTLPQFTSACLLANCTMHDSLVVAKVTASVCDYPHPDRSDVPITVTAVVVTLTTVFILLRLVSKQWVSRSLGAEDWIIGCALLLSFVSTYFTITFCHEGFGKHLWDLNDGDLSAILENFYISESIYVIDLALSKISILVFYLRIFPHEWFRYVTFGTIAMISASTIIIFLMTVFSCHPVGYFWDRDLHGQCLDVNALAYANSGMSIAQDLIIVALPLPVLTKLNMTTRRKIGVGFMFAVGSFGCIISMIRLKALISFGSSIDPTWDYVDAVTWTTLELAVAMICACLPAIRNLLVRLFPRAFLTTVRSSTPNTKTKKSNSRTWRSGSRNPDSDGGDFIELQEGAEASSEALGGADERSQQGVPGEHGNGKISDMSIEVVNEVWVHSSPRRQEPSSSV